LGAEEEVLSSVDGGRVFPGGGTAQERRRWVARAGVFGMIGCRGYVSFDNDGWWGIIASLMSIFLDGVCAIWSV
jgi:hypothetical protein